MARGSKEKSCSEFLEQMAGRESEELDSCEVMPLGSNAGLSFEAALGLLHQQMSLFHVLSPRVTPDSRPSMWVLQWSSEVLEDTKNTLCVPFVAF